MIKTIEELADALEVLYPTRYSHFTSKQEPPFICYLDNGEDNFHADNVVLVEGTLINVELYTQQKDLTAEKNLKELFKLHELSYAKSPTIFIESEGIFQCVFSITLIN